jgi:hypothetical protein
MVSLQRGRLRERDIHLSRHITNLAILTIQHNRVRIFVLFPMGDGVLLGLSER